MKVQKVLKSAGQPPRTTTQHQTAVAVDDVGGRSVGGIRNFKGHHDGQATLVTRI